MNKILTSLFSLSILFLAWQLFAFVADMPYLVPSVPSIFYTLKSLVTTSAFYHSLFATLIRGICGMLLSLAVAGMASILFSKKEWLYEIFRPFLSIMRSVPVISFILLALIFLEPESIPIFIAFLTMFPLLTENLTKGIRNQHTELGTMGRLFRISSLNRFTQIIYPQLKPFLYSGLASAAGFGWRAIIMGEVLAQCQWGIGGEMKRAQLFIAVPQLIAWTVMAILISFLFDKGIGWISKQNIPIRFSPALSVESENKKENNNLIIRHLFYSYTPENPIFTNFSYLFETGKIYGISAPSGKGKTTLLNLIGKTIFPQKGNIDTAMNGGIAFVQQIPALLAQLSVIENVAFSLSSLKNRKEAFEEAERLLDEVELTPWANSYPSELSFGQCQRVALARALVFPSPLLLMDEPFKGLDEALTKRIIERIRIRQLMRKQTILFTSHNEAELNLLSDEILYLNDL